MQALTSQLRWDKDTEFAYDITGILRVIHYIKALAPDFI